MCAVNGEWMKINRRIDRVENKGLQSAGISIHFHFHMKIAFFYALIATNKNEHFHMFMSANPKSAIIFLHLWHINAHFRTYVAKRRVLYLHQMCTMMANIIERTTFLLSQWWQCSQLQNERFVVFYLCSTRFRSFFGFSRRSSNIVEKGESSEKNPTRRADICCCNSIDVIKCLPTRAN